MPITDRLTDKQVRAAKPRERAYKLTDGAGMYLLVQPHGVKLWRLKYRVDGREKVASFGQYPDVSLSAARAAREAARRQIHSGLDPVAEKRAAREARRSTGRDTFGSVARSYFTSKSAKWSENHLRDVRRMIDGELVPALGRLPMRDLRRSDIERVIGAIVARGALTYAQDVRGCFRRIVRHFNQTREQPLPDPSALVDIPVAPPVRHHAALPASEVGEFLRRLQHSEAMPMTRIAVRLLLLTAVRTSELRCAEWREIDTSARLWRVPAIRMKARQEHLVPLCEASLELLASLRTLTGSGRLLFPNVLDPERPMTDMTILAAIYRLGYKGRLTGHGMRRTFSTWANEQGFHADAIERQLAHGPRDKVRAAYNSAEHLPERRRLMDAWATFLETAERESRVVPLRSMT